MLPVKSRHSERVRPRFYARLCVDFQHEDALAWWDEAIKRAHWHPDDRAFDALASRWGVQPVLRTAERVADELAHPGRGHRPIDDKWCIAALI